MHILFIILKCDDSLVKEWVSGGSVQWNLQQLLLVWFYGRKGHKALVFLYLFGLLD